MAHHDNCLRLQRGWASEGPGDDDENEDDDYYDDNNVGKSENRETFPRLQQFYNGGR